jgi:hypothetical protein
MSSKRAECVEQIHTVRKIVLRSLRTKQRWDDQKHSTDGITNVMLTPTPFFLYEKKLQLMREREVIFCNSGCVLMSINWIIMTTTNNVLIINIKFACYHSLLVATDSNLRKVKTTYEYYRTKWIIILKARLDSSLLLYTERELHICRSRLMWSGLNWLASVMAVINLTFPKAVA